LRSYSNGRKIGNAELRDGIESQVQSIERMLPEDIARLVTFIVASPRRVAVNEILVRAADQTW
jgi:NADP-dependent 3-hydroxy acid dehydrogenase YdfG